MTNATANPSSIHVQWYRAVWRWHFYASIFVIPFLLVLTLTGLLMLISKPIDAFSIRHLSNVTPAGNPMSAEALMDIVVKAHPSKHVQLYIQPKDKTESARFSLIDSSDVKSASFGTPSILVYQNPYTGEILGERDPKDTLYTLIKEFHGSMYLGDIGDKLLEIASGLAVLMVISGLYLAFSKQSSGKSQMRITLPKRRDDWRYLHKIIGIVVALPLLFFLISGLAWTSVWGSKLVQPWGSLPGTKFDGPKSHHTHESTNQEGVHQVPWALEQTPLPIASAQPERTHQNYPHFGLDEAIQKAKSQGFEHLRVHLPGGQKWVWTVSATTMAGDISNPLSERTIHIDPANGRILADLSFSDYPAMGKAMAAGIPLHEAGMGLWNLIVNLILVSLMVFIIVSGIVLWWKRRPSRKRGIQPPVAHPRISKFTIAIMAVISLLFPLSAVVIFLVIFLDWLAVSRITSLRAAIK